VGLVILTSVNGQVFKNQEARHFSKNSNKVWLNNRDSTLKFIEFKKADKSSLVSKKTNLAEVLNLTSEMSFVEVGKLKDVLGVEHVKNQQHYHGIPIEGGIYSLHGRNGNFEKANGEYFRIKGLDTKPAVKEPEAYLKAEKFVNGKQYSWEIEESRRPLGKLVILPVQNDFFLAYKFDIYSVEPLARKLVFVDASNGKILKVEDLIRMEDATGTALTKYQNTQQIKTEFVNSTYRLRENNRGNGIQTYNLLGSVNYTQKQDFKDTDNFWNTTANQDNAATSVHYSVEKTYDFFLTKFGRNSFDNSGGIIQSFVHYGALNNNAFWDGSKLFFGDGDGINLTALTSTDIVAHEFGHAITQYSANLYYSGESGALNESFSDIFGVTIDFYANPATANFIVGEQVYINGSGFRNMGNPNQFNDPDTYKGTYWYTASGDNGGVHTNSGVQNYWYFLLSNGGTGTNDLGNSYNISGIGLDKAIAIAYRNLTVYLTPNSDFEDARFYSIQSAIDLFGQCSPEVIAVTNAWYAVGVGEAFSDEVIVGFEVSRTNSCSLPFTVDFSNTSANASSYLWDFGDGSTSVLQNPTHIYTANGNYSVKLIAVGNFTCSQPDTLVKQKLISVSAFDGLKSASCNPQILLPSNAGILNFSLATINNTSGTSLQDGGYVDYSCSANTSLKEGERIPVSVTTGEESDEDVRIWLDLNNNGEFSSDELIYTSDAKTGIHTGNIIVPKPSVYNNLLRLRVVSDLSGNNIFNACNNIQNGQAEDYAMMIIPNTDAPVADFSPVTNLTVEGDSISFINLSLNAPESYEWYFPGGSPASSTLKNPKVLYPVSGDYTVSLKVTNAYGDDQNVKEGIAKVRYPYVMKSDSGSTETSGLLFDSGGPKGKYLNNENSDFLIDIPCASEIKLVFQQLDLESCCDYIQIFDGKDNTGKLIYPLLDVTRFDTLLANSGHVFINFSSDGLITKSGFAIEWTSNAENTEPVVALYSISKSMVDINEEVVFINQSSDQSVNWKWDFGDESQSTLKNSVHRYSTSGLKNVKLIVSNCYSADTIIKQIQVTENISNPLLISIPDQVIYLSETRVIKLSDFNTGITDFTPEMSLLISDDKIVQAELIGNELIISPLSIGESELTINLTQGMFVTSDTFKVKVLDDGVVGVEENLLSNKELTLIVYPNPVRDRMYIRTNLKSAGWVEYSILSLTGELAGISSLETSGAENITEIDVENLNPGLYIIQINTSNGISSEKFIKE
jgi:Zn-dependent metalloprotease